MTVPGRAVLCLGPLDIDNAMAAATPLRLHLPTCTQPRSFQPTPSVPRFQRSRQPKLRHLPPKRLKNRSIAYIRHAEPPHRRPTSPGATPTPRSAADRIAGRPGWNVVPAVAGMPGAEGERIAGAAISPLDLRPWTMVSQMGANAALRGDAPGSLDAPLAKALSACQGRRVPVLRLGPQIAPAISEARRAAVERALEASARRHRALWPPRGEGVSVRPDGLHHDDAGHAEIGRRVADALVPLPRTA